jgi:hypothetical protein
MVWQSRSRKQEFTRFIFIVWSVCYSNWFHVWPSQNLSFEDDSNQLYTTLFVMKLARTAAKCYDNHGQVIFETNYGDCWKRAAPAYSRTMIILAFSLVVGSSQPQFCKNIIAFSIWCLTSKQARKINYWTKPLAFQHKSTEPKTALLAPYSPKPPTKSITGS